MTVGKAAALTVGFVGAVALGIAIGPSVTDRLSDMDAPAAVQSATGGPERASAPSAPARPRAKAARPRSDTTARETSAPGSMIPASEPRLHERLKPVLNRGARMELAAEGFRSAEEFATVAHAARNTNVPFMVLKHRVVTEGRTLADAIHELKPEIDAKAEVRRAQMAAKSDLAALVG
jgi:hypothetical protein